MIAWNIAPGLRRTFAAEAWPIVPAALWHEAREEAFDLLRDDVPLNISGSDIDPAAIEVANAAAKAAGLAKELRFTVAPVAEVRPEGDYGCIITNPPYGERLGDEQEATLALRQLGTITKPLPTWSVFILNPDTHLEHYMGRPANKKRKLFNGRIECAYYQYFGQGGLFPKKL
jgi:putative N6-adenine-specific DNA methylase